jgi:hypothetical protein
MRRTPHGRLLPSRFGFASAALAEELKMPKVELIRQGRGLRPSSLQLKRSSPPRRTRRCTRDHLVRGASWRRRASPRSRGEGDLRPLLRQGARGAQGPHPERVPSRRRGWPAHDQRRPATARAPASSAAPRRQGRRRAGSGYGSPDKKRLDATRRAVRSCCRSTSARPEPPQRRSVSTRWVERVSSCSLRRPRACPGGLRPPSRPRPACRGILQGRGRTDAETRLPWSRLRASVPLLRVPGQGARGGRPGRRQVEEARRHAVHEHSHRAGCRSRPSWGRRSLRPGRACRCPA